MNRYLQSIANTGPAKRLISACDRTVAGRSALNRISPAYAVYPSIDDAWTAARRIKHAGHEHPLAVDIHMRFSARPRPSDYPVLFWLSNLQLEEMRIFDFGGNVGNLYYCYKAQLPEPPWREWIVFDLPDVLEQGRAIARPRGETALRFTDSMADAAGCNVLLASGSLHYWERSVADLLHELGHKPRHVFVNRTPVRESGPSFAALQVTDEYCVPCIVRSSADLISDFESLEYELVDRWSASELALPLPLHPDYAVPAYTGMYFRLHSQ